MTTIGAYEAKTHFAELLRKVEGGEPIVITRHGVPVARMVPVRRDYESAVSVIEAWRTYRKEHNITLGDDVTIKELIEEGRE